jgi:hypothetical protein
MLKLLTTIILILIWGFPVSAADLGVPHLSDSKVTSKFFDPDRLITSGGLKYKSGGETSVEPQFGLGYTARDQALGSGYEQSIHKVHAQAGGKFDLGGNLYLSAAAKLPVFTYEMSDRRFGTAPPQDSVSRRGYDFTRAPLTNLKWTGEVGIRLGVQTELSIYYDQTMYDSFQPGFSRPEERFGTRFILRFK